MFYQKKSRQYRYSVFRNLEAIPGLVHAITNRETDADGEGGCIAPEATIPSPGGLFLKALGISKERLFLLKQTHSDRLAIVDPREVIPLESQRTQPGDGIILTGPGCFAAIRTADCVPLLAVLPQHKRVCLIHAGWRGTCQRITVKGIRRFLELSGARPEQLWLGVGPCIRRCCYQVGPDVRNRFLRAGHDVGDLLRESHLDLVKANIQQAAELGVVRIEDSGLCTACRSDLFYSYRRDGSTGRNWAIAGFAT